MTPAVIDACCLIDLLVSGHMEAILRASKFAWRIPTAIRSEIQYIRQHDPIEVGTFIKVPVDLTSQLRSGLLSLCEPENTSEERRFVQYAAQFRTDGEAMFLAIAESRGWPVATDDRKAIRVAQQAGLTVISCPELVKAWFDATKPDSAALVQLLTDIQTLAQFRPNATMPQAAWWLNQLSST